MASSRWIFVADVGGRVGYHVGDEAMLDANVSLFRRLIPGLEVTVVSEDPAFTANAYGVNAVSSLGFSVLEHASDREHDERLAFILARAAGDQAPEAIRVLQRTDGLVISGGGNLSDSWPHHVYERAAFVEVARRRGIPVVILGQTLGPDLSPRHRALVSGILNNAIWVGVREAHSYSLALHMGVSRDRLSYQVDDAITLTSEPLDEGSAVLPRKDRPWIAVTIHPVVDPGSTDVTIDRLASALGELADVTGARLVFIPHQDAPTNRHGWSDRSMGEALANRIAARHCMLVGDIVSARQTRWLTSQADLVVSTRYHPIVFGLASGVPCLGISTSQYTRVKLEGALIHAGRATDICDISEFESGAIVEKVTRLWSDRASLREKLQSRVADWHATEERRARALGEALRSGSPAARHSFEDAKLVLHLAEALHVETEYRERIEAEWVATMTGVQAHIGALEQSRREAVDYAESLQAERELARNPSETTIPNDTAREVRMWEHPGGTPSLPDKESSGLSEEQWNDFDRDGFMYLGKVLESEEINILTRRADDLALGRLVNPAVQMQLDTGGAYDELPGAVARFEAGTLRYRKIQGLETDDRFARLIQKRIFREVCARMYGRHANISIFRAMIMNMPAEQGTYLPWHQDGGNVWQLDRDPLVTIWVALDPATRANGCMEAVVGSHRLGLLSQFGSTVSEDNVALHRLPERIQTLEVPAGHAVFIHNWLIHRSGINPTSGPRRAFTMCCMDARTRNVATGEPFPVIYGASDDPHPYVLELRREQAALRETAAQAERYAISLRGEGCALRKTAEEATIYARSLEQEVVKLSQMRIDAERYARSLEAELKERSA